MGEALITRRGGAGSGSDIVNGILEEYYAESETIEPNTFVELSHKEILKATQEYSKSNVSDRFKYNAVEISPNVVFCAIDKGTDSPYVGICTIGDENTITFNTFVSLDTSSTIYNCCSPELIKLSSNKVLAIIRWGTSYLYAFICTISNNKTITISEYTSISSNEANGRITDIVLSTVLENNDNYCKIVVQSLHGSSYYAHTIAIMVDKTTNQITKGSKLINNNAFVPHINNMLSYDANTALFFGADSTYGKGCCIVYTVSDLVITKKKVNKVDSKDYVGMACTLAFFNADRTKIRIIYSAENAKDDNYDSMITRILDYNNNTGEVTFHEPVTLDKLASYTTSEPNYDYVIGNDFIIMYNGFFTSIFSKKTLARLYDKTYGSFTNSESDNDINLTTNMEEVCCIELFSGKLFQIYPEGISTESLIARLYESNNTVKKVDSHHVIGVTKTKATSTSKGKVWISNV